MLLRLVFHHFLFILLSYLICCDCESDTNPIIIAIKHCVELAHKYITNDEGVLVAKV